MLTSPALAAQRPCRASPAERVQHQEEISTSPTFTKCGGFSERWWASVDFWRSYMAALGEVQVGQRLRKKPPGAAARPTSSGHSRTRATGNRGSGRQQRSGQAPHCRWLCLLRLVPGDQPQPQPAGLAQDVRPARWLAGLGMGIFFSPVNGIIQRCAPAQLVKPDVCTHSEARRSQKQCRAHSRRPVRRCASLSVDLST